MGRSVVPISDQIARYEISGVITDDVARDDLLAELAETEAVRAVVLRINSPGGTTAGSEALFASIREIAEIKPVVAVLGEVAASGGYWLATAADRIHVDPNSITGSIGVIYAAFGFPELLARHGVERRVHTAGEDKSLLDPFRPERPKDVERLKRLQAEIHENFIDQVKTRRGDRLKGDDLFTGEIWVGAGAIEVGLVDEIGHLAPTMHRLYGEKTKFRVLSRAAPDAPPRPARPLGAAVRGRGARTLDPFRIDRAMIVKLALFLLLVLVALGFVGRLLPRPKGPPARRVEA
ncbi:hypothetical protein CNY89_04915, partial [Amaricoccus sp. HAR-UPW-R2A-40]